MSNTITLQSEKYLQQVDNETGNTSEEPKASHDYLAFVSGLAVLFFAVLIADHVLNWIQWADGLLNVMG